MQQLGKSIAGVAGLVLAMSGSAFAQQFAPPEDRGYIAAFAGAVSGPPAEPMFSVEYGEHMTPHAVAYVSLGYMENLMTQRTRDAVAAVGGTWLAPLTGVSGWDLRGRDRGVALTGGAKVVAGTGTVRPYVGAGAGIINLKRTITEAYLGDVTAAVFNDFAVGDVELSLAPRGITRPLGEIIGGVGFASGPVYVDLSYRYRRAFRLAEPLEFSQFSAGIGYRF